MSSLQSKAQPLQHAIDVCNVLNMLCCTQNLSTLASPLCDGFEPLYSENDVMKLSAAEYQSGSSVFLAKIRKLEAMYASIRRARGDGNCFFRSFIFAYMEHLVFTADLTERNRYIQAHYLSHAPIVEWLNAF